MSNINTYPAIPQPFRGWQWQERAITKINTWEKRIEEKIPNFLVQIKIDQLGQEIEKIFSPLVKFNKLLNEHVQGSWFKQLAVFLITLPVKAARNIIQQLYTIIRGVIYGLIHPLHALNSIAKLLVMLPYEFTRPEMYSKMGAGIVGTGLGDAAISGGFASLIAMGLGVALIIAGVTAGTLKTLIEAEYGHKLTATKEYLLKQAQELPETTVTSFYMGLIIGGIRRAIKRVQAEPKRKQELHSLEDGSQIKRASDFYQVVDLCRNNPEGFPPVAYAVKLGRHDIVKFLIDHNESLSARTPGFEVWDDFASWMSDNPNLQKIAPQPGYTPLELAIQKNDVEMVKILISYNPANRALVTESATRWRVVFHNYWNRWMGDRFSPIMNTPLSSALENGNKEIIEQIIKAYSTKESLFQGFEQIRATQQESLMRIWLEQNAFLLNGEQVQIADATVKLFLTRSLQDAMTSGDVSQVLRLLENGWVVSKQDVIQLFGLRDPSVVKVLMNGANLQGSVNPVMIAVETGAVDALKSYVLNGYSIEGVLLHAVQEKQKSIVEYLLELPLSQNEIREAYTKAYEIHAYEIMELLEKA